MERTAEYLHKVLYKRHRQRPCAGGYQAGKCYDHTADDLGKRDQNIDRCIPRQIFDHFDNSVYFRLKGNKRILDVIKMAFDLVELRCDIDVDKFLDRCDKCVPVFNQEIDRGCNRRNCHGNARPQRCGNTGKQLYDRCECATEFGEQGSKPADLGSGNLSSGDKLGNKGDNCRPLNGSPNTRERLPSGGECADGGGKTCDCNRHALHVGDATLLDDGAQRYRCGNTQADCQTSRAPHLVEQVGAGGTDDNALNVFENVARLHELFPRISHELELERYNNCRRRQLFNIADYAMELICHADRVTKLLKQLGNRPSTKCACNDFELREPIVKHRGQARLEFIHLVLYAVVYSFVPQGFNIQSVKATACAASATGTSARTAATACRTGRTDHV